jgi:hypothetical protein
MTAVSILDLVTIPQLGAADPLDGTEKVVVDQVGVTKRTTTADIAALVGGGALAFTAKRAVAVLAGNTDNWAPDLTDVVRLELTAAGSATITGLAGGTDGRYLIVTNVAANDITLLVENAGSSAANRFAANGDIILDQGWSATFLYSAAAARWTRVG